ncbi:MAG: serine/threonine protein kinase [Lachnospiraceae bacterium]|nr:serine/threonine protein kinase [Lachnospiraceae bacterium]
MDDIIYTVSAFRKILKKGGVDSNIDRYKIISTLSSHPHSTVWLAEHISLGVKRIIKGVPADLAREGGATAEADILKDLDHPDVPEVYDVFEENGYFCIVEEYFEGKSLARLCTHRLLSSKEVSDFITQICSIIRYLHGLTPAVLHLDIKPENVIISDGRARLIDLGSAVRFSKGRNSDSMSRGYAAPEQEAGLTVDCGSDVFALGKLLDFMAAHSSADRAARAAFARISGRCCEKKPWKRVSTAETMLKMLNKQRRTETEDKSLKGRAERRPPAGGVKIGVFGLGPRCGTTHIAIALANCLADSPGREICLTERSDRDDLAKLPALRREGAEGKGPVRLNGVTYLTAGYAYGAGLTENTSFDAVIFDLGCNMKKAEAVLSECDIRIAVAGAAPWREKERESCKGSAAVETHENSGDGGADKGTVLLINPADDRLMRDIRGAGVRMLPFPFEPDPMNPGKQTKKILERAIR